MTTTALRRPKVPCSFSSADAEAVAPKQRRTAVEVVRGPGRRERREEFRMRPGLAAPSAAPQRVGKPRRREALVRVADQLCAELGYRENETEVHGARSPLRGDGDGLEDVLSPEDESLVATMRGRLAKVAAAAATAKADGVPENAVGAALDGTELVIRGELVRGNAERLPALMPSFVFLVTLPIVEQDEALDLSRRVAELVEQLG